MRFVLVFCADARADSLVLLGVMLALRSLFFAVAAFLYLACASRSLVLLGVMLALRARFFAVAAFLYLACASRSLFYASLLQSSVLVGNLC